MTIVGIDLGIKGAIGWDDGEEPGAIAMPLLDGEPNLDVISGLLLDKRPSLVVMEMPHPTPTNGVSGTFCQALHAGLILGLLHERGLRVMRAKPSVWKRRMGIALGSKATSKEKKERAIKECRNLFPSVDLIPAGKRVEQDGIAEAMLLAEYGRREIGGKRG